jgi:hypothetical protein
MKDIIIKRLSSEEMYAARGVVKALIYNSLQDVAFNLSTREATTLTRWTYEFKASCERIGILLGQDVYGHSSPEKGLDISWHDGNGNLTLALESEWDASKADDEVLKDFDKVLKAVSSPLSLGVLIIDGGEDFGTSSRRRHNLREAYNTVNPPGEVWVLAVEGGWRYKITELDLATND